MADRIPGNHRGVPDLAWNAAVNGGVLVYTSFFPKVDRMGWHVYGGTSASSPQIAGLVALANEQQRDAGQPPLATDERRAVVPERTGPIEASPWRLEVIADTRSRAALARETLVPDEIRKERGSHPGEKIACGGCRPGGL